MCKPLYADRWVTTSCMMRASSYASVLRTDSRWVIWGLSMRASAGCCAAQLRHSMGL